MTKAMVWAGRCMVAAVWTSKEWLDWEKRSRMLVDALVESAAQGFVYMDLGDNSKPDQV